MEVTRREMLTAASAIGVTAALAQSSHVDAAPDACDFANENDWCDVDPEHFDKAVRMVRQSGPEFFNGFTTANLTTWYAAATADKIRRVRGYYHEEFEKEQLRNFYSLSYKNDQSEADTYIDYRFYVAGCRFRSEATTMKKRARIAVKQIIRDLKSDTSLYKGEQTQIVIPNISGKLMKGRSFISMMLRYLKQKQNHQNAANPLHNVTFVKNSPPSTWTLTVNK
ncbi:hypothetical protein [Symmachiella dynata]|uniref:hypothetical protein n=1 Tax=Symmachiella dynata TaxID=2527995 RepID=UPI0030EE2EFB